MKVVLDTNVLVSALLNDRGNPAAIVRAWRNDVFQLVTSPPLLQELANVLFRPRLLRRLAGTPEDVATFIADLAQAAIVVSPASSVSVISDPPDNRVLEAAIAARADYVVSGDSDLAELNDFQGVRLVTPARFAAILAATV